MAASEKALDSFIACLRSGRFEPGLRVTRVQGYPGVWEMTWAADGRATFEYGQAIRHGGWDRSSHGLTQGYGVARYVSLEQRICDSKNTR